MIVSNQLNSTLLLLMGLLALILCKNLILILHCTLCAIVAKTALSCKLGVVLSWRGLEDVVGGRQLAKIVNILWVLGNVFSIHGRCLLLRHELRLGIIVLILALNLGLLSRLLIDFLSFFVFLNQLLQRCLDCWSNFLFEAIQGYKIFDKQFKVVTLPDDNVTSSIWSHYD